MTNEAIKYHKKVIDATINCTTVKKIFILSLLLITMPACGQKLIFRPEPNFNSLPDTTSRYLNFEAQYGRKYKIIEYIGEEWVKVLRDKYVEKHDKNGKFLGGKYVKVAEYIDLESLNPYVIKKEGGEIHLRSKPEKESPVILIVNTGDYGIGEGLRFPDNDKKNETYLISNSHYNIIGSTKKEWIQFCAIIGLLPRGKPLHEMDDNEIKEFTNNLRNQKSINDTIYGYVDRQSFEANMELQPLYTPSVKEKAEEYISDISDEIGDFFEYRMSLRENFHIWILILLGLNLIVLIASQVQNSGSKVLFILDYCTLLSVFILELVYIAMLENKFWWCSPDKVGWLKAILFFIITLALTIYQFGKFFHILHQITERSKPFNTFIGITLFTIIAVVMFIYAIFAGGLDDDQNRTLINILIATQILQIIITTIQLRKYPLYALMVLLLIPLGTFAILLSFLRLFVFLCLFGLLAFVFYCWVISTGNGSSKGSGGRRGDAQHCPHCKYPYCTFGGHNHRCSLINGSTCRHGQF